MIVHAGFALLDISHDVLDSFIHFHLAVFPFQSSLKKPIPLLHADSANAEMSKKAQEVSLYISISFLIMQFDGPKRRGLK